jgi:hypothetical protein
MNKEIEDLNKTQGSFWEEINDIEMRTTDVEMSVKGAYFQVASIQEDISELNDVVTNVTNQLELVLGSLLWRSPTIPPIILSGSWSTRCQPGWKARRILSPI